MNENAKTGTFWAVALATLVIALFLIRSPSTESDTESLIGNPLFPEFTDPLVASNLRIVTFNEDQGELRRFEVSKDPASGAWSLPSRDNYPADATDQMQNAANALVGLKVLDIQTENPEDHGSLGVVEPKGESLELGDEGVGRLVVFRGEKNASLANLIVGRAADEAGDRRYVRIPGQNPVYVVSLDDSVFSSRFEDWIEKDLLQISGVDVRNVTLQQYDATLQGNSLSMNRSYDAKLAVDASNQWDLLSLVRYDDQNEPREVLLEEDEQLASSKLNALKNALDSLRIVDVRSKPKGMTENLKAEQELVSDNEAVRSLANRGFFPVSGGEIYSANGEMDVTLENGVQYVLRFGRVEGLSDEQAADEDDDAGSGGVNRYLLVTTQVDESRFPPPELQEIPKSIEELEAMQQAAADDDGTDPPPAEDDGKEEDEKQDPDTDDADKDDADKDDADKDDKPSAEDEQSDEDKGDAASETSEAGTTEDAPAEDAPADEAQEASPAEDAAVLNDPSGDSSDPPAADEPQDGDSCQVDDEAGEEAVEGDDPPQPEDSPPADEAPQETPAEPAAEEQQTEEPDKDAPAEETEEEKQERLEAEQERITKENQRKIDERKDRLEAARRRVRELNNRFAQWYYVIPDSTYRNLRISYADLIETAGDEPSGPQLPDDAAEAPSFDLPGFP